MSEHEDKGSGKASAGNGSASNGNNNDNDTHTIVNKISIKVPPFYPDRPALWFAGLEAQFHINSITQESTKFYYVVSQLDAKFAMEVEDIITTPPTKDPYTSLKQTLISRYSESPEEKIRRLVEREELGDRKPSSFLRHLRLLAGPTLPESILKTIWMNRLPLQIQGYLLAQPGTRTVEELGDLADRLYELNHQSPKVYSASGPSTSDTSVDVRLLHEKVDELTRIVASLSTNRRMNNGYQERSRSRSRSRSRPRNPKLCWYHDRFGPRAKRCEQPCTWLDQNVNGRQGNQNSQ